jgi:hypothetical protein
LALAGVAIAHARTRAEASRDPRSNTDFITITPQSLKEEIWQLREAQP